MANGSFSVKVTGNVTEALAALEALGIKAQQVGDSTEKSMNRASSSTDKVGKSAKDSGEGMGLLAKAAITIGPALAPLGTVAAGLATGLGGIGIAAIAGFEAFKAATGAAGTAFEVNASKIFSSWQTAMQPIVSPVLTQALGLLKPALADLTPIVQGVSQGLSVMAKSFQGLLANPATTAFFKNFGQEVGKVFTGLAPIISNLFTILMHAFQAAEPLINIVLGLLQQAFAYIAGTDFNALLGPLISNFQKLAPIVGAFLVAVGRILGAVLKAISPVGVALFQVISTAVSAVMPVIATLGKVIGAIAPIIGMVAQSFAGVLSVAIRGIAPILQNLLPIITEVVKLLGTGLINIFKDIEPAIATALPVVAKLVQAIAAALGPAIKNLAPLISDLSPLTFIFAPIAASIGKLAPLFGQLAQAIASILGPAGTILGTLVTMGAQILSALIPPIMDLVTVALGGLIEILNTISPILPQIANLLIDVVGAAVKALAPVIRALAPALQQLIPPIVQVVQRLVTGLQPIIKAIIPLLPQLAGLIGTVLVGAIKVLTPILVLLADIMTHIPIPILIVMLGALIGPIALVGAVAAELYTHWAEIWGAIKQIAMDVWNDGLKYVLEAIVIVGIGPIALAAKGLEVVWQHWGNTIKSVVSDVWDFVKPIFNFFIDLAIDPIMLQVHLLQAAFHDAFGTIENIVNDLWHAIQPVLGQINRAIGDTAGAVSKIGGAIGKGFSAVTSVFGDGGYTPGAPGQPSTAIVHGGEFVLSAAMLQSGQGIPPEVVAAISKNLTNGSASHAANLPAAKGGGAPNVQINMTNGPTTAQVQAELVWVFKQMGFHG